MSCLCQWWCRCSANKEDDLKPFANITEDQNENRGNISRLKNKDEDEVKAKKDKNLSRIGVLKKWCFCCTKEIDVVPVETVHNPYETNRAVNNPWVENRCRRICRNRKLVQFLH